ENPEVARQSAALRAAGGRVPYLFRWEEVNRGLEETVPAFRLTGLAGGRPAVPVLANLTTGELVGYAGQVPLGEVLALRAAGDPADPQRAAATLGVEDVTARLFSLGGWVPGVPFDRDDLDAAPRLPRLARGANDWLFLAVGLFDLRGLNRFF